MAKKFFALVTALLVLCVSGCAEKRYMQLEYEVVSTSEKSPLDREDTELLGYVSGGVTGMIVADLATDFANDLDIGFLKSDKTTYTLRLLTFDGKAKSASGIEEFTVEGRIGEWEVGDKVRTVERVGYTVNNKGCYVYSFNRGETSDFEKVIEDVPQ